MSIDVADLLKEISTDAPCGEDISYDPAYLELERLVQGTPETQFSQSEEPNWPEVVNRCLELGKRSRNLRVAIFLALGLQGKEGVTGLRDGLALVQGLLERYWDHFYPKLDPDDNSDPTERLNIIAALSPAADSFQDPFKFKNRFSLAPLCSSRQVGRFGLRDIQLATGEIPVLAGAEGTAPQIAMIHAAFDDVPIEEVQGTHRALMDCMASLKGIETALAARVPPTSVPKMDSLRRVVEQADKHVQEALARRGYGVPGAAAGEGAAAGAPATARVPGAIASKEDVIRTIDRICEFYEKTEPSSPVPLLLKRAKRLVGKTFVDIIRDMTPEAMSAVDMISGAANDPANAGAPK